MHIHEYQQWLEQWDRARGWEAVLPSHILLHATEELGEVSKLIQMIEGYRPPQPPELDQVRDLLALELSDLLVMVFKLGYLCGIDLEDAMRRGMEKADRRFPDPADCLAESEAAWSRFRAYLRDAGLATRANG